MTDISPGTAVAPPRPPRPRPEARGFELAAYYDAIGLAREAAHAAWREQPPTLELEELRAMLAADAAADAEAVEPLAALLARLARELEDEKAAAGAEIGRDGGGPEGRAAEIPAARSNDLSDDFSDGLLAEFAHGEPDPEDLASLESLLETARRMEQGQQATAARASADRARDAAHEDSALDDAPLDDPAEDSAETDPAARLAEVAGGAESRDAALISAISAGRLAIVFDRGRSAALEARAEASGCAPEDVVVTGLDWYLDALAGG